MQSTDVLVINCGSSSIKADILDAGSGARSVRVRVERVGEAEPAVRFDGGAAEPLDCDGHESALAAVLPRMLESLEGRPLVAVGHRVVHGGDRFSAPTVIDAEVEATIEALIELAPLHNPANLAGIRGARRAVADVPHVAVFDTAFHATLPAAARTYALPYELASKHGIRRYGFHGISHEWVAARAADHLGEPAEALRLITCHLGNGASATAIDGGRSVETSMGMTPLEGLVMGTRSGDVDPGAALELARREGLDEAGLDELLNKKSGLLGLSGVGNDMRDIGDRAAAGEARCELAVSVFAHRLLKYVGAYAAVLGGVDAVVFTAGIGENSALARQRVGERLGYLGADLDPERNRAARVSQDAPVAEISRPGSRTRLLVVATDEEHAIARRAARLVRGH